MLTSTAWPERLRAPAWAWWSAVAILALAAIAGAGLGVLMTSPEVVEPARAVFGEAWVADGESARGTLAGLLGVQITLIGLVLSASSTALYGLVANQSLRLVRFIEPGRPLFRAVVGFAVTTGYVLAATRRLGPPELQAPRPVVTVGVALAVAAVTAVILDAALSLRKQHISRVLRIVTTATERTIAVARARTERWSPARGAMVMREGVPLRAHRSGYVVDVDARRLLRHAVRSDARIRIDRTIGDYVAAGEPIGRVSAPSPLGGRETARIARALLVDGSRSPDVDVGAGIRVLVDIAERALSPAVNDPYTGCEALYRLRGLLRELASVPDGDWLLADEAGTVRVSIARPTFDELLRLAVDGPSRYGAGDPDLLDAVLDVAAAVGREPSRRESARRLVARVLDDASSSGMSRERVAVLESKARLVLAEMGESTATPRLWRDVARSSGDA